MSATESPVSGAPGRRRKPPAPAPQDHAGRSRGTRRRKGGRRANRRSPLIPILVGALIIAVIALVVTVVLQFTGSSDSQTIQAMPSRYQVYESGQANELLANRDDDPRPFTERDFFREGDTDISSRELTFTLHAQDITENCTEAVWGPRAVAAVFKLRDIEASRALADGLAPADDDPEGGGGFLVPPTTEEPFTQLGSGYSSAEATVNGHYLLVLWVQSKTSTSTEEIEVLQQPLVTLSRFDMPIYQRINERKNFLETQGEGTGDAQEQAEDTGAGEAPAGDAGMGEAPAGDTGMGEAGTGLAGETG